MVVDITSSCQINPFYTPKICIVFLNCSQNNIDVKAGNVHAVHLEHRQPILFEPQVSEVQKLQSRSVDLGGFVDLRTKLL